MAQQIVDQDLRVNLLLDIERRRLDDQFGPILLVFAAPDELRVEIAVAPLIGEPDRALVPLVHYRFEFGGRKIAALVLVPQRLDLDLTFGHVLRFPQMSCGRAARSLAARTSMVTKARRSSSSFGKGLAGRFVDG